MISRDPAAVAAAAAAGEIIAYPTEGCFGLGCHPMRHDSVARLIRIKGRPAEAGLILIGAGLDQLGPYIDTTRIDDLQKVLSTWPGPVTWVMPATAGVPSRLTGGRRTVAVRVTDHPLARRLCQLAGTALVSTSANRHGRPPATTAAGVAREMGAVVPWILEGTIGALAGPTEIRDARTGRVLRAAPRAA